MEAVGWLTTGAIVAAGAGAFLRMVAKEKHRRDRHLQLRLEERAEAARRQKSADRQPAAG